MHANHREEIDEVRAGDIASASSVCKDTTTGDTLCDEKKPIILESMEFPEPVIRVAIEPKTKAGQDKMGIALIRLAEEDPTFKTYTDEETGQTIIAGMGELHLEIIVDRLLREFKVEATVGAPQVAYKETVRKRVKAEGLFKSVRPAATASIGHCCIEVYPREPGEGYDLHQRHRRRRRFPRNSSRPSTTVSARRRRAACLGGYEVVDFGVALYRRLLSRGRLL